MKTSDLFITRYVKATFENYWIAYFLGTRIEATAASKEDAINNVIDQIRRVDQYGNTRVYRFAKSGVLFHMYFAYDCFCYDIVHPDTGATSSCHMNAPTYQEAYDQMMRHVAQYDE